VKTYKPIFIIGSYRGGTSLMFRLLSESSELWSLYREADFIWKKFFSSEQESAGTPLFQKVDKNYFKCITNPGQRFDYHDERKYQEHNYHYSAYSNYALGYLGRIKFIRKQAPIILDFINIFNFIWKTMFIGTYRFIDKTPPNSYRIELLQSMYPDAKFIYLVREREANVQSLISAWTHPKKFKFAYRKYLTKGKKINIEGYSGKVWKFFITPGFESYLEDKTIREVCEFQYDNVHQFIQDSLSKLDPKQYIKVNFEDLLAKPDEFMQQVCEFAEISYSPEMKKLVKRMPEVNKS
jgi:hypothetical protein